MGTQSYFGYILYWEVYLVLDWSYLDLLTPVGDWYFDLCWAIPSIFVLVASKSVLTPDFQDKSIGFWNGAMWTTLPYLATRVGMGVVHWEPTQKENLIVSASLWLLTTTYLSVCDFLQTKRTHKTQPALLPNVFPLSVFLACLFFFPLSYHT